MARHLAGSSLPGRLGKEQRGEGLQALVRTWFGQCSTHRSFPSQTRLYQTETRIRTKTKVLLMGNHLRGS